MENGIIKLKEICKVYTDRLSELLADGYVLNAKTTPGTQGEYGRMDLTKDGGKTVRRIYMDRGYTNDGDLTFYSSVDTLSIIEEDFENVRGQTLWNGRGKLVNKQTYYLLDRKRSLYEMDNNTSYVKDLKIVATADKKHYDRCENYGSHVSKTHKFKATPKVLSIVNQYKGFKTVKLNDIDCVEVDKYGKEIYYRVVVKNKPKALIIEKGSWKNRNR